MTRRALVLCPGRGSYSRKQLGSLQGRPSAALDAFDALRAEWGQPGPRALDAADRFSPRTHIAGEHASILTAGATLADVEQIDRDAFEIVGVVGNSMGWYTALGVAGALSLQATAPSSTPWGRGRRATSSAGRSSTPSWARIGCPRRSGRRPSATRWRPSTGCTGASTWADRPSSGTRTALKQALAQLPPIPAKGHGFPLRLPSHSASTRPCSPTPAPGRRPPWQGWAGKPRRSR